MVRPPLRIVGRTDGRTAGNGDSWGGFAPPDPPTVSWGGFAPPDPPTTPFQKICLRKFFEMIRTAPPPQTAPRKNSGENFSAEKKFRPTFFRPKKIRPKNFRSKNFSAEKFAVRIAEGGSWVHSEAGYTFPW